ncbi:MAG: hypothetical protein KF678_13160 [Phycisphaeraceae bacterium]|nr:hypothetical protein [Phycisphaeraceae bacterium]
MKLRTWTYIASLVATAATVAVWIATGAEGFTRWPNERLKNSDAAPSAGESDLLADAGFSDDTKSTRPSDIQSRFALGLVPGGADPRHLLSVATTAGAALAASGLAAVMGSRRKSLVHRKGASS